MHRAQWMVAIDSVVREQVVSLSETRIPYFSACYQSSKTVFGKS